MRAQLWAAPLALALLIVGPSAATPQAESESPLARRTFVQRSLSLEKGTQDEFAASFNVATLPLLARAIASREAQRIEFDPDMYAALTRWHFWMGKRWDDRNRGLWSTDPVWLPVTGDLPGGTLATLAALEMVQLGALSEMALRRGQTFDALVWNDDRSRLRQRILEKLHDPLLGGYADLDSFGQRNPSEDRLSSLLPIALGAPALQSRGRHLARQIWTDGEVTTAASAKMHALDRAEQLHGWTSDAGIHLLEPQWSAALSLVAIERLGDAGLRNLVSETLSTNGLSVRDSIEWNHGDWKLALDPRALEPSDLHASRVSLSFLRDAGLVAPIELDSLLVRLSENEWSDATRDSLIEGLTDALIVWRGRDMVDERRRLRVGKVRVSAEGAAFRWREEDLRMWSRRALDGLTEDIVAHHLRPSEASRFSASLTPNLLGRGGKAQLELVSNRNELLETDVDVTVAWTDGRRVIPAEVDGVRPTGEGLEVSIADSPREIGVWWAIVRAGGQAPRSAPSLAVVEPIAAAVRPYALDDGPPRFRLETMSQVGFATAGRVEIAPPLSWSLEPSHRLDFTLEAGEVRSWEMTLRPDSEVSPAIYPVTWTVFDQVRQVAQIRTEVAVHYRWLRLNGLPADGAGALAREQGPDRSVDLAKRYRGVDGTKIWSRLPGARLNLDGWIDLATRDEAEGAHYALTAFTTGSREATLQIESDAPVLVRVNGEEVVRIENGGGSRSGDVQLVPGTNFLLVKMLGGDGHGGRFRIELRDIEGDPIRGVDNSLEHLIDGYAYISGGGTPVARTAAAVERDQMRLVTITYRNPAATRVFVVGSFNGWSPTATPMTRTPAGHWEARIRLRPGRFEYKFAVDGARWIADPINPINVLDGFGTRNSVIVVD